MRWPENEFKFKADTKVASVSLKGLADNVLLKRLLPTFWLTGSERKRKAYTFKCLASYSKRNFHLITR